MRTAEERGGPPTQVDRDLLAAEWRRLGRAATAVAVLTSPATFGLLWVVNDLPLWLSAVLTLPFIAAFRGAIDVLCHRLLPRPSLYDADERLKAEDVVFRRRRWYWRTRFRRLLALLVLGSLVTAVVNLLMRLFGRDASFFGTWGALGDAIGEAGPEVLISMGMLFIQLPLLFLANFLIFFGPLLMFGVMQMKAFEPGDADWGVRLADVRGQEDSKAEVERVITLWAAGDEFKKAGGKPERGLLLIGAPGTGKTMLSKAIATSFNSPIMTMPGSGFAQTFIGLDVVMVMILIARARRLARKWGGTCMVFIDEIDAVGMRRNALGGMLPQGAAGPVPGIAAREDHLFFGPWGDLTPTGDLRLETPAWRERVFAQRAAEERAAREAAREGIRRFMFPGMGGTMALNQLLVQMDGMDNPPLLRKFFTKKLNTFLDALYVVPQAVGGARLRLRPPAPRSEQVYFIGATNVPLQALDPALIRPGRMGRHIFFRTPNKRDRADVFDLYLGKVAHDPDLDRPARRDELARITGGYSPAMIEQVCSMALTYAHGDGRVAFAWQDLIEAMTTIESGTASGFQYVPDEKRAVAIHEAGHAVASHVYMDGVLSTRLSVRARGNSGGHHQAIATEEKMIRFRHEQVAEIVWGLGAMAAERVFYGENSQGVGGDLHMATTDAALMVGAWGMGPEPVDLGGHGPEDPEERRRLEREVARRFERLGMELLNRSSADVGKTLSTPGKVAQAAQILGQAYITAFCLVAANKEAVARIADVLVEREEIHGDEVVALLDGVGLRAPDIDLTDESIWPRTALVDDAPPPWEALRALEAPR
jgi:cell division protease FtsH